MIAIRKKLVINDLPSIDYYNAAGHWLACIYERYQGWWSVRLCRVELLSCYHTEDEAKTALAFWLDISPTTVKEYIGG